MKAKQYKAVLFEIHNPLIKIIKEFTDKKSNPKNKTFNNYLKLHALSLNQAKNKINLKSTQKKKFVFLLFLLIENKSNYKLN